MEIIEEMTDAEMEVFFTKMLSDEQAYLERLKEEDSWNFDMEVPNNER